MKPEAIGASGNYGCSIRPLNPTHSISAHSILSIKRTLNLQGAGVTLHCYTEAIQLKPPVRASRIPSMSPWPSAVRGRKREQFKSRRISTQHKHRPQRMWGEYYCNIELFQKLRGQRSVLPSINTLLSLVHHITPLDSQSYCSDEHTSVPHTFCSSEPL